MNEYVDDWSCQECGKHAISDAEDACPECGSTWAEQNDIGVDDYDLQSFRCWQ